jgi:hypothetical protein
MVRLHRSLGSAVLILAAAAILPACGAREDVRVTVNNNGASSVHVVVEVSDDEDQAVVAPGSNVGFKYDTVLKLKLTVWRESDGLLLFSNTYDEDEIRREHDHISVTVTP